MKRNLFRSRIIRQLYFSPALSNTELSVQLKKSIPFISGYLNDLIDDEVVIEKGYAPSTGGRRPLTYVLNPAIMYTVSVAMDQFTTRIAILNMNNEIIGNIDSIELPLQTSTNISEILAEQISSKIKLSGIPQNQFVGIGVAMPGFVDIDNGYNLSFPGFKGTRIPETIGDKTGLPVVIGNDSAVIALAESRFGVARGMRNAMVVNIGWGIGLGMIINGELFRGNNGFAGEFSHIPLFLNGKLCSCGKRGCLETETSLVVLVNRAREGLKEGRISMMNLKELQDLETGFENLVHAALEGDQFAVELIAEDGYNIGRGVAILIHLLNPEAVILSGRGASAGKLWLAPIQQALNEHCIPRLAAHTSLHVSSLGFNAEIFGAAALVMENLEKIMGDKNLQQNGISSISIAKN